MSTASRRLARLVVAGLVGTLLGSPLAALELEGWGFSLGAFDVARPEKPFELGIHYRFEVWERDGSRFLPWLSLQPAVGVSTTEDGNAWAYLSIRHPIDLGERWTLALFTGVGLYEEGDGKDLGGLVEFRSGLELAHRLGNGHRLGVAFYHLSNAVLYDDNPGANSLVLTYSLGR